MAASLDLHLTAPAQPHPEGVAKTRSSQDHFAEASQASLHPELLEVGVRSVGFKKPVQIVDGAHGQRRRAQFTGCGGPVSSSCNRAQGGNLPGSSTASAPFQGYKPICRAASVPASQASPAALVPVSQRTASLAAPPHSASLGGPGEWAKSGVSLVISRSTSLPQQSCRPVKSSLKKTMSLGPGSSSSLRTVTFKESVSVRRFKHRMDTPGMIVPVLDITSQF